MYRERSTECANQHWTQHDWVMFANGWSVCYVTTYTGCPCSFRYVSVSLNNVSVMSRQTNRSACKLSVVILTPVPSFRSWSAAETARQDSSFTANRLATISKQGPASALLDNVSGVWSLQGRTAAVCQPPPPGSIGWLTVLNNIIKPNPTRRSTNRSAFHWWDPEKEGRNLFSCINVSVFECAHK